MSIPLRVLHCWSDNRDGGVDACLATLARQARPGLEPEYALCVEGTLANELRAAGAMVHDLGAARLARPWTIWRVRRSLRRLLNARLFDVVICHGCWSHLLCGPAVSQSGGRLVFWFHGFASGGRWIERFAAKVVPHLALADGQDAEAAVSRLFSRAPRALLRIVPPESEPAAPVDGPSPRSRTLSGSAAAMARLESLLQDVCHVPGSPDLRVPAPLRSVPVAPR